MVVSSFGLCAHLVQSACATAPFCAFSQLHMRSVKQRKEITDCFHFKQHKPAGIHIIKEAEQPHIVCVFETRMEQRDSPVGNSPSLLKSKYQLVWPYSASASPCIPENLKKKYLEFHQVIISPASTHPGQFVVQGNKTFVLPKT